MISEDILSLTQSVHQSVITQNFFTHQAERLLQESTSYEIWQQVEVM